MNVLDLRSLGQPLDGLLKVEDRKLAGLAVIGVAKDARVARRPSVDNGQPLSPEEVPQLRQGETGVLEGVVVAVHVNVGVLAGCQRQPPYDLGLHASEAGVERRNGLGVVDDLAVDHLVGYRRGRQTSEFVDRNQAQLEIVQTAAGPARRHQVLPRHFLAQIDDCRANGERVRSLVAIAKVAGPVSLRRPVGHIDELDLGAGVFLRQCLEQSRPVVCIEVRCWHQLPALGASGDQQDTGQNRSMDPDGHHRRLTYAILNDHGAHSLWISVDVKFGSRFPFRNGLPAALRAGEVSPCCS